ncbi:hypothetical protein [Rhodococcus sp. ACT016]|uniref:hypothetical protein n=1 Tax=Rhodococcus sp. ACT016 TaxID=3134808 RepID=UPI003D26A7BE
MASDIEKVTVIVSAHRLDSYRSVEARARQQWACILRDRDDQCLDAGLHLVDNQSDSDLVDHLVYRFEGTVVACAAAP